MVLSGSQPPGVPVDFPSRLAAQMKDSAAKLVLDTSGSMNRQDKIPLLKRSLRFLVDQLQQGDTVALDDDLGFVPLLHLAARYRINDRWSFDADFDGLAGGPGRAFDAAIKLQHDLTDRWRIGAGYRTLEGGADNDTVYNFAWFHYAFISMGYRF